MSGGQSFGSSGAFYCFERGNGDLKCFCTCFGVFQPNFFLFQGRPDSLKAPGSSLFSICWAACFCLELTKQGRFHTTRRNLFMIY